MPTVEFSLKDLNGLIGKELNLDELDLLLGFAKAELEDYDEVSDTLTLSFGDTNQPYLWSVEGLARLLKGVLGIEKGISLLKIRKPTHLISVDKNLADVRPFIAAFIAVGVQVSDALLKQLIQFQEKLCDSFGLKRRKIAVGIYPYQGVSFPVSYKAVEPRSVKFMPLEFRTELNLAEILKVHPAGQKFAFALDGLRKYPILMDSKGNVLSFPPIINSQKFGKVDLNTSELFIEVTGTDFDAVNLICTILAYAFADRGFEIEGIEISYPDKKVVAPVSKSGKIKIKGHDAKSLLGIDLSKVDIKKLLEKARFEFDDYAVSIPPYRHDILHPVDVIEEIGVMYGYDRIPTSPLTSYTTGDIAPIISIIDKCRDVLAGFGFQEIMSAVLSGKELLYERMNTRDFGTVEIRQPMSAPYSVVRSWILPILLDVLSKNKHHDYPQYIFEEGLISLKDKNRISDHNHLAAVCCGQEADYTKIRQILEALLRIFGINYSFKEFEHDSFIPGRVAQVFIGNKPVAFVGELHPVVLHKFGLNMPVAGFELDVTALFDLLKS